MSTVTRTLGNLWRIGPRMAGHQMQYIGDTKAGTLIGKDKYGNSYYENVEEELPLRTRWVDYHDKELDASQIEPGWHAWISYMTHDPPSKDTIGETRLRIFETPYHRPNPTASKSSFRTYNTVQPKVNAWTPKAISRQ